MRIQSEVELLHRFEENKPTENMTSPTEPSKDEDVGQNTEIKRQARGIQKKLGRTSMYRRAITYTTQAVSTAIDTHYDKKIFQSNLMGDRRSMAKDDNKRVHIQNTLNTARSGTISLISARMLKNNAIFYLYLGSEGISRAQTAINMTQQKEQTRVKQEKEMFEANKRRDRLIVGTYNRRG